MVHHDRLARARNTERTNHLVLRALHQIPVRRLGDGVNVGRHFLPAASFEHAHHLFRVGGELVTWVDGDQLVATKSVHQFPTKSLAQRVKRSRLVQKREVGDVFASVLVQGSERLLCIV